MHARPGARGVICLGHAHLGSGLPTWSCLCRKGLFGVDLAEANGPGISRLCPCAKLFPEAGERGSGQATAAVLVWKGGPRRLRGGLGDFFGPVSALPSLLCYSTPYGRSSSPCSQAWLLRFALCSLHCQFLAGAALHLKSITLI